MRVYRHSKTLPKKYLQLAKKRHSIPTLMKQLNEKLHILEMVSPFPERNIPLNITIFILNRALKNESLMLESRKVQKAHEHKVNVHINHELSLQDCPAFKTGKCVLFGLVYMLNVLHHNFAPNDQILKTLSRYCK